MVTFMDTDPLSGRMVENTLVNGCMENAMEKERPPFVMAQRKERNTKVNSEITSVMAMEHASGRMEMNILVNG